ncbi:hypothetical protein CEP51_015216 [Fusarium floridanum]|uniref:Uncharacterized protein n=1 Tax=Fusarium floridanum TaxID=1325733 RepID=A0A428PEH1_9HYPO|nr:hypothetical protein CEP51_015216 [Fusarium floridanum]
MSDLPAALDVPSTLVDNVLDDQEQHLQGIYPGCAHADLVISENSPLRKPPAARLATDKSRGAERRCGRDAYLLQKEVFPKDVQFGTAATGDLEECVDTDRVFTKTEPWAEVAPEAKTASVDGVDYVQDDSGQDKSSIKIQDNLMQDDDPVPLSLVARIVVHHQAITHRPIDIAQDLRTFHDLGRPGFVLTLLSAIENELGIRTDAGHSMQQRFQHVLRCWGHGLRPYPGDMDTAQRPALGLGEVLARLGSLGAFSSDRTSWLVENLSISCFFLAARTLGWLGLDHVPTRLTSQECADILAQRLKKTHEDLDEPIPLPHLLRIGALRRCAQVTKLKKPPACDWRYIISRNSSAIGLVGQTETLLSLPHINATLDERTQRCRNSLQICEFTHVADRHSPAPNACLVDALRRLPMHRIFDLGSDFQYLDYASHPTQCCYVALCLGAVGVLPPDNLADLLPLACSILLEKAKVIGIADNQTFAGRALCDADDAGSAGLDGCCDSSRVQPSIVPAMKADARSALDNQSREVEIRPLGSEPGILSATENDIAFPGPPATWHVLLHVLGVHQRVVNPCLFVMDRFQALQNLGPDCYRKLLVVEIERAQGAELKLTALPGHGLERRLQSCSRACGLQEFDVLTKRFPGRPVSKEGMASVIELQRFVPAVSDVETWPQNGRQQFILMYTALLLGKLGYGIPPDLGAHVKAALECCFWELCARDPSPSTA